MNATHTPGPGTVDIGIAHTRVQFPNGAHVNITGMVDPRDLARLARLIAAAPEMRDALAAVAPLLPEDVQDKVEALLASIDEDETDGGL